MVDDEKQPDGEQTPQGAPAGRIMIDFPRPNSMAMTYRVQGVNTEQLAKAAAYLTALATMRIQEEVRLQVAAENAAIAQQARLIGQNGHGGLHLPR